jgi:filamentous hemagglutinin
LKRAAGGRKRNKVAKPVAIGGRLGYLYSSAATEILDPLTPEYLLAQLPADLVTSSNLLFFADPYVESQLLARAALTQSGHAYFVNGQAGDDRLEGSLSDQERQQLYDNAAVFSANEDIRLGQALTEEQQGRLDAPMLWYVEQQVPDGHGGSISALVPTLYLPELDRQQLTNLAGGMIQGQDVDINVSGTLRNSGYITGENVSITAGTLIQEKRQADIGREFHLVEDGYLEITGTRVQPGAFISAANLSINAQRIESISGEFQVLGATAEETQANSAAFLAKLRGDLGDQFVETEAQDNLHVEAHINAGMDIMQVVIIVAAIVISIYTAGAASAMIGGTLGASGGTFAAATAATATTAATSAGIGNMVLSAAIASMTSSAFTGLATGNFDAENVLRAGVVGGLTAGLTNWLAPTATSGVSLGAAVNWAERAAISAGVNAVVNGGDFGESFLTSFVTNAAAGAANWIGDNAGTGELLGEVGSFGHVASHALLGCAAAAATDQDCASGAIGGATSAFLTSFLDAPTNADGSARVWTDNEKLLITAGSTLVGGLVVGAMGGDVETGRADGRRSRRYGNQHCARYGGAAGRSSRSPK